MDNKKTNKPSFKKTEDILVSQAALVKELFPEAVITEMVQNATKINEKIFKRRVVNPYIAKCRGILLSKMKENQIKNTFS